MSQASKILDCSSITTALESIESVTHKSKISILEELEGYTKYIEESDIEIEDLLYELFFQYSPSEKNIYEKIAFFHITRTCVPNDFLSNGILPTKLVVEKIWDLIGRVIKKFKLDIDVIGMREKLENDSNSMYYHKLYVDSDGPYGFLIRETAYNKEFCSHFTKAPEILVDICRELDEKSERLVLHEYQSISTPYIIKFHVRPRENEDRYIGATLKYIYLYSVGNPCVGLDNGFDAEGQIIKHQQIINMAKL